MNLNSVVTANLLWLPVNLKESAKNHEVLHSKEQKVHYAFDLILLYPKLTRTYSSEVTNQGILMTNVIM